MNLCVNYMHYKFQPQLQTVMADYSAVSCAFRWVRTLISCACLTCRTDVQIGSKLLGLHQKCGLLMFDSLYICTTGIVCVTYILIIVESQSY